MRPDCAVLDISMHESAVLRYQRLKASGSNTKIIFLTVHEDSDFVEEAVAVGAIGYVEVTPGV